MEEILLLAHLVRDRRGECAGGEVFSSKHGNNGAGLPGHRIGVFQLHSHQERSQSIVFPGRL